MKPRYELLLELITGAKSIEDLRTALQLVVSDYDLGKFTYQIVQNNALDNLKNFYVTTFPNKWEQRYLEQNYFDADPLVNLYKSGRASFVWRKENNDNQEKTNRMFSEAAEFNLHHGVGIPLPGPNNSFSILTLCSENSGEKKSKKFMTILKKI